MPGEDDRVWARHEDFRSNRENLGSIYEDDLSIWIVQRVDIIFIHIRPRR